MKMWGGIPLISKGGDSGAVFEQTDGESPELRLLRAMIIAIDLPPKLSLADIPKIPIGFNGRLILLDMGANPAGATPSARALPG
jgi:hypothetical protein